MASIFTRIVQGEIPSHQVAEDEHYLAFLDINPLARGHTLVIPKKETDYLFDMEAADYQGLFLFARKVAIGMKKCLPCERIGMAVLGMEVPHAHIHLVPVNSLYDIDFSKPKLKLEAAEMAAVAAEIASQIE